MSDEEQEYISFRRADFDKMVELVKELIYEELYDGAVDHFTDQTKAIELQDTVLIRYVELAPILPEEDRTPEGVVGALHKLMKVADELIANNKELITAIETQGKRIIEQDALMAEYVEFAKGLGT